MPKVNIKKFEIDVTLNREESVVLFQLFGNLTQTDMIRCGLTKEEFGVVYSVWEGLDEALYSFHAKKNASDED